MRQSRRREDTGEHRRRAYLESNGNIAAMAARLHVHNNTMRYRVTRLAKDFSLDLEDPREGSGSGCT